ncbi:MAG: molecular chaperone [Polaromonas sp.]|nr:molecular chaperone [Polaromonas sp.]
MNFLYRLVCHVRRTIHSSTPLVALLLLGSAIALPSSAIAGAFSVSPVRIYMLPRERAVAVTVVNEGDTEVVLQADINAWTQKPDGTDELNPTDDLILSPPIIRLAPNSRQVVRLALLKPADASRQLIYRMIMREVPEAVSMIDRTVQLPVALALSMPVFITPPPAKRIMDCATAPNLTVRCSNSGTAYAQVREILIKRGTITLARFEGGTYILPGAQKVISLKAASGVPPGAAQMSVSFDDGKSQIFEVTLP